jgi:ketosteroid isomerase-like protein
MVLSKKQVIEKVNDTFARGDIEGFLSFCAEDFVFHVMGAEVVRGKDAVRKWLASGAPEPPKFSIDTVVADGDFVTVLGDMTMHEKGVLVPYAYCDVWRFAGDKLVELRAFVIKTSHAA